jgi:hypothetical protein
MQLTYMASPNRDRPTYGFISNGGSSIFVKATNNPTHTLFERLDFQFYYHRALILGFS